VDSDDEEDHSVHTLKVIKRKPHGEQLHYKNVLANISLKGRFQNQCVTHELITNICCDIDQYVAEKRSIEIGKPCCRMVMSNKRTRDEYETPVSNKRIRFY
tara:strand:+ start:211 stop:513 length:303 start_codon:yes stop_codon:yes gene_type:complete